MVCVVQARCITCFGWS